MRTPQFSVSDDKKKQLGRYVMTRYYQGQLVDWYCRVLWRTGPLIVQIVHRDDCEPIEISLGDPTAQTVKAIFEASRKEYRERSDLMAADSFSDEVDSASEIIDRLLAEQVKKHFP